MKDEDLLELINTIRARLNSEDKLSWPFFGIMLQPLDGSAFPKTLLSAIRNSKSPVETMSTVEDILKREFDYSSKINLLNPFMSGFSHYQYLSKIHFLSHSLNAVDRKEVSQSLGNLKSSILGKIVSAIISSIGTESLYSLADHLSKLLKLDQLPSRQEMIETIERSISRPLTEFERSRLDPLLSAIGGWHHRQHS